MTPHGRLDLISKEHPPPAELVPRQQSASRVFEHRRDREVQQVGNSAAVENVVPCKGRRAGA